MKLVFAILLITGILLISGCANQRGAQDSSSTDKASAKAPTQAPIQTYACPDGTVVTVLSNCPKTSPPASESNTISKSDIEVQMYNNCMEKFSMNDLAGTKEACTILVQNSTNSTDVSYGYTALGMVNDELNSSKEALTDFDKAIELDSFNMAAYLNRGRLERQSSDFSSAISDYGTVIRLYNELNSSDRHKKGLEDIGFLAGAYAYRGLIKRESGDLQGAMTDYSASIKLNSSFAVVYNNRGVVKYLLGDIVGAKQDINKSRELDPNLADFESIKAQFGSATQPSAIPTQTTTQAAPTQKQTHYCSDGTVVNNLSECPNPKCTDGTNYSQCSQNQPKYCEGGILRSDAVRCGCPSGYEQNGNECQKAYMLGESAQTDKLKVTVISIQSGSSLEIPEKNPEYFDLDMQLYGKKSYLMKAADGEKLILIKIAIENIGNTEVSAGPDQVSYFNEYNRSYSEGCPSNRWDCYDSSSTYTEYLHNTFLLPNESIDGYVIYHISYKLNETYLTYDFGENSVPRFAKWKLQT